MLVEIIKLRTFAAVLVSQGSEGRPHSANRDLIFLLTDGLRLFTLYFQVGQIGFEEVIFHKTILGFFVN